MRENFGYSDMPTFTLLEIEFRNEMEESSNTSAVYVSLSRKCFFSFRSFISSRNDVFILCISFLTFVLFPNVKLFLFVNIKHFKYFIRKH